jgi:hypothetical protein
MKYFQPLSSQFKEILPFFIAHPLRHAKWLNTLSYLENCGARKIARSEDPQTVSKEVLKHAAEEFRHAFYLKQQIATRLKHFLPTYQTEMLIGGNQTLRYLDRLELHICRLLKTQMPLIEIPQLKHYAYLLVTYAIELRASELYPLYQELLIQARSPISVRSILLDEKGHLEEMEREIAASALSDEILKWSCLFEGKLCKEWLHAVQTQVATPYAVN